MSRKFQIGLTALQLGVSEHTQPIVDSTEYLVLVGIDEGTYSLYPSDYDPDYDKPITIHSERKYNAARPHVATSILRYSSVAAATSAIENLIDDGVLPSNVRIQSDNRTDYLLDGSQVVQVLKAKNSGRGRVSDPNVPIWYVLKLASANVENITSYVKANFGYDPNPTKLSDFSRRKTHNE